MQEEHTKVNEIAWNQMAYEAWVCRFGNQVKLPRKLCPIPHLNLVH